MNKENFKILIEDLYNLFGQSLDKVDDIVDKYNEMQLEAIHMVIFKYNNKSSSLSNPIFDRDDFQKKIILSYSNGEYILKNFNINDFIDKKEPDGKMFLEEISATKKQLEKQIEDVKKNLSANDMKITLVVNHSEEVFFPNSKHISMLGVGSKIIAKTKSGKPVGLIIDEILYDCVEDKEAPNLHIYLSKH